MCPPSLLMAGFMASSGGVRPCSDPFGKIVGASSAWGHLLARPLLVTWLTSSRALRMGGVATTHVSRAPSWLPAAPPPLYGTRLYTCCPVTVREEKVRAEVALLQSPSCRNRGRDWRDQGQSSSVTCPWRLGCREP